MEGTNDADTRKGAEKEKESRNVEEGTNSNKNETPAKISSVGRDEPHDDCNENYDDREMRTFTIRKLHAVVTKQFIDYEGQIGSVEILNLEIASPTSVRRFISVHGRNARNLSTWLL